MSRSGGGENIRKVQNKLHSSGGSQQLAWAENCTSDKLQTMAFELTAAGPRGWFGFIIQLYAFHRATGCWDHRLQVAGR